MPTLNQQVFAQSLGKMPEVEYRFHPVRKWRFDYAWPKEKIALEVDGGVWSRGRHTRGAGFIKDQEKRNHAVDLGWRVFHCTPENVFSDEILNFLRKAIND